MFPRLSLPPAHKLSEGKGTLRLSILRNFLHMSAYQEIERAISIYLEWGREIWLTEIKWAFA